jgi:hypothetical protein
MKDVETHNMLKRNNLFVGWLDTNVKEVLKSHRNLLRKYPLVMVTSIDSTTQLVSSLVGQKIKQRYSSYRALGDGIILATDDLIDADDALGLFFGFDELWFFQNPPFEVLPKDICLVGPFNIESQVIPMALEGWIERSNCRLGLGDGVGLNCVTPDPEIASILDSA